MFGKTADQLSYTEKQAGMLEGVLEKLEARTAALPDVFGTTAQMAAALRVRFKDLWGDITTFLLPVARSIYRFTMRIVDSFKKLIAQGGALYGPIRKITAAFVALSEILTGVLDKILDVSDAGTSALEDFADNIISTAWKAIEWGANIITNLAIGIVRGASTALVSAMNFIAKLLADWLAPGSAPKIVADILSWGTSAFTEFLKGFTLADWDILEGLQAPLKRIFQVLVDLGKMTAVDAGNAFISLSADMAAALDQFTKTGTVPADIFAKLAAVGGDYGDSLVELFKRQLALATAMKTLAAAEERLSKARDNEEKANTKLSKAAREYNKLVRQGADPAVLKAKLAEVEASYDSLVAAREETDAAEEAEEAARKQVKAQKELVRLQEKLVNQLITMGQAMADLAKAQQQAADDADDIEWPDVYPLSLDEAFDELVAEIKKKFETLWAELMLQWQESGAGQAIKDLQERWDIFRTETLDPLLGKLNEVWDVFKLWVLDPAWAWVLTQWDKWGEWWDENGPGIKEKLKSWAEEVERWLVEDIWQWVLDEWDEWKKWWEEDGPTITTAIDLLYEKLKGREVWKGITWYWDNKWSLMWSIFTWWVERLQIAATGGMAELRLAMTLGSQLILGDWEGASKTLEKMWLTALWTLNTLTDGRLYEIGQKIVEYADLVRGGLDNFVVSLNETLDELVEKGSLFIYNLIEGAKSEFWRLVNLGDIILDTLSNALTAGALKVINAFADIIDRAVQSALDLLGIGSPSKVFTAMGQNLVRGFTEGINDLADTPAVSVKRMVNLSMDAASTAGTMNTGATTTITVNNNFGRDSVRSDADIYKLAEQMQRSLTLRGARSLS